MRSDTFMHVDADSALDVKQNRLNKLRNLLRTHSLVKHKRVDLFLIKQEKIHIFSMDF